ncbi:MAG: class I SAM-dependent methyltransferase, partial [Streptosporangiaceae bacterium]
MADDTQVELGVVQETLFVTLAARARESRKSKPVLRDPKAAEMVAAIGAPAAKYERDTGAWINVLRTAIFDSWVHAFLAEHPAATVVEIGTGLNTRFERVDNGQVHWIDMDLPDTIELRRRFFTDSGRRRMLAASVLDDDWMPAVRQSPGPYFVVSEGVLAYLPQAPQAIARIAAGFPSALVAFDTYPQRAMDQQHKMAAKKKMGARWAWACDDPRTLEPLGLHVLETTPITRPPRAVRDQLPTRYHLYLP